MRTGDAAPAAANASSVHARKRRMTRVMRVSIAQAAVIGVGQAILPADTLSSVSGRRLTAAGSQDWLPHSAPYAFITRFMRSIASSISAGLLKPIVTASTEPRFLPHLIAAP